MLWTEMPKKLLAMLNNSSKAIRAHEKKIKIKLKLKRGLKRPRLRLSKKLKLLSQICRLLLNNGLAPR
jgi:cell division septal protein FtsQ